MGWVAADHSGFDEKSEERLVRFKVHVPHEAGVKVAAGYGAQFPDAISEGQSCPGSGSDLRL